MNEVSNNCFYCVVQCLYVIINDKIEYILFSFLGSCLSVIDNNSEPEWNTFKVTWGPNPLNKHYFSAQPLTVIEAKKQGFIQISNKCDGKYFSINIFIIYFLYLKTNFLENVT